MSFWVFSALPLPPGVATTSSHRCRQVVLPVLRRLHRMTRTVSMSESDHGRPLQVLAEMCEVRAGGRRPVCDLMVTLVRQLRPPGQWRGGS